MFSDVYMIILTAFALLGLFCLIDGIIMSIRFSAAPRTVTVMLAEKSFSTYDTVQYIHNTLYNNEIIVISEGDYTDFPMATVVQEKDLHRYITNALFTKN